MFSSLIRAVGILTCYFFISSCGQLTIEGYYWRDYYGAIPSDAYGGGKDVNGQNIYIGQALVEKNLFVVKIYESTKKAHYGFYGKSYVAKDNIKILCTITPEQFIWVPTVANATHSLTEHHLVRGGYEPDFIAFIGRIQNKGETTIGKIIGDWGLYVVDGNKETLHSRYQILTYSTDIDFPVDVRSRS